jgi:hypothetical protein
MTPQEPLKAVWFVDEEPTPVDGKPKPARDGQGTPEVPQETDHGVFTKVLVFMDVSSPDLLAASAAAQEDIKAALDRLQTTRRVFVRVLVHGYQLGLTDVDSTLVSYDRDPLPADGPPAPEAMKPRSGIRRTPQGEQKAAYVPADPTALMDFVEASLLEKYDDGGPYRSILFIWGHGQGVGTRLQAPRGPVAGRAAQRLPATVDRPSLLNVGGFEDHSAVEAVKTALANVRRRESVPGTPVPAARGLVAGKFDLIVLDSCLMAAAELAFEFREVTSLLIASETFVERPGMNLGLSIAEYLSGTEFGSIVGTSRIVVDTSRPLERAVEGAKRIIDLAGALRTGASQMTLFRLRPQVAQQETSTHDPGSALPFPAVMFWSTFIRPQKRHEEGSAYRSPSAAEALQRCLCPNDSFLGYGWFGLFWAFTQLIRWASADADEYPRIVAAFRRTVYGKARQFLDLKDLARQVHQYSRLRPLQIIALELMRELEEHDSGFIVRSRALTDGKDKARYGGVSIYCPWFRAEQPGEYDSLVDHDVYRQLALPKQSNWAGFVLGPLYAPVAGQFAVKGHGPSTSANLSPELLRTLQQLLRADASSGRPDRPTNPNLGTLGDGGDSAGDDDGGDPKGAGPQAGMD